MKNIYIIDASNYLYRSYYAIRNMSNSRGEATNALFGFIRFVQRLRKDFHPDHLVVVFDGPDNKKKRAELYPAYKGKRQSTPEDLPQQIDWASTFCDLAGIPKLTITGVEADDTMGAVAVWAAKQGAHAFLCSSDKDLCQLVGEGISVLHAHNENRLINAPEVEALYGVPPHQIIDFLAIAGDASDNVPGLSGFGAKTAAAMLKQFGSLENLLARPEEVKGEKKQQVVRTEGDKALLSKTLVTIDLDVPFPKDPEFLRIKEPQYAKLKSFYQNHNFGSLLKDLEASPSAPSPATGAEQTETEPKELDQDIHYQLVDDEASLHALVEKLKAAREICFNTETTALHPLETRLVGLGFCIAAKTAWYVPVNGKLGLKLVLDTLKPLFESPDLHFFGHNVKYDLHLLLNHQIVVANVSYDTMLASYLLNSHSHRHSLDHLAAHYFNKTKIPIKELIGSGQKEITMDQVPIEKVCTYCCEDVDYTFRLKELMAPELISRGLDGLLNNLEMPLLSILMKMERHGIYLNVDALKTLGNGVIAQLKTLEEEIHALAGEPFTINSPKQLSVILFEKMGIAPPKKIATGFSTSADVLEELQDRVPLAAKVLEYRSLEKLRSTYIETLPLQINPASGRIHCTFNQSVAATGRLSCQDPNLQNIPIRSELGREIREAFLPERAGWSYLSADYSQVELRLLAHLSEDPNLLAAFNNNEDIHTYTASLMFAVHLALVTKEMRQQAKAINFGILYGQQAFGLARELGIPVPKASAFIKAYFNRYGKVQSFLEECKEKARQTGKATTLSGRERIIADINSKNGILRSAAERLAINTPIQGTAADLIKFAMIEVDKNLTRDKYESFMVLQIHDELLFECPDSELLAMQSMVRKAMEGAMKLESPLKVSLAVDITVGKNWKEC